MQLRWILDKMRDIFLEGKDLYFRYNEKDPPVIDGVNITLEKGKVIGIVGLSGSGKTTLIQILNGLIPKRIQGSFDGSVILKGKDFNGIELQNISREIGTVYQDPDTQIIFSRVEDELAFGPENLCIEKEEILKKIEEALKLLNIEHLRYRNPNKLSGGEKQLVVIASILTLDVDILILDESMSQIDERGKKLIKKGIESMKSAGKAIIMVEHDIENLSIADEIFLLKDGKLKKFEGNL